MKKQKELNPRTGIPLSVEKALKKTVEKLTKKEQPVVVEEAVEAAEEIIQEDVVVGDDLNSVLKRAVLTAEEEYVSKKLAEKMSEEMNKPTPIVEKVENEPYDVFIERWLDEVKSGPTGQDLTKLERDLDEQIYLAESAVNRMNYLKGMLGVVKKGIKKAEVLKEKLDDIKIRVGVVKEKVEEEAEIEKKAILREHNNNVYMQDKYMDPIHKAYKSVTNLQDGESMIDKMEQNWDAIKDNFEGK